MLWALIAASNSASIARNRARSSPCGSGCCSQPGAATTEIATITAAAIQRSPLLMSFPPCEALETRAAPFATALVRAKRKIDEIEKQRRRRDQAVDAIED